MRSSQRSLFDDHEPERSDAGVPVTLDQEFGKRSTARTLARSTDPATSKQAAEIAVHDGTVGNMERRALWLIATQPDRTQNELDKLHGGAPRSIGRRLSRLVSMGLLEVSGSRVCEVSNRNCQTYRVTELGGSQVSEC